MAMFADDTLLCMSGKSLPDVPDKAASDLMIIKRWLDQNVLKLIVFKTKWL